MTKYFKVLLRALWKPILGSFGICLIIGLLLTLRFHGDKPALLTMLIPMLAWVLLWALGLPMVASVLKKEEPLEEILNEHGYCDAWLQKHSEIYPNPNRSQKLQRVSVLSYLNRYDDAKALLDSIPTVGMNDDQNYEYRVAVLDMLMTTNHFQEAQTYLESCRKFMDIYANDHPLRGVPYGCNAAVILAVAGDFDGSEHYLNAAEHALKNTKGMSLVMVMIARTMQLYALDLIAPAEQQEQKTYEYIISPESQLNKQWQRDHFLAQLGRAQQLTPDKRQETVQ